MGALDLVCLVTVCSGVCAGVLANVAVGGPQSRRSGTAADVALASRGLSINLRWGDFIEACFPFMARNAAVNWSAHAAAAVGAAAAARVGVGGGVDTEAMGPAGC